ncbi:MAG: glycosyl hydrolase, partial [Gemmatimonadota bacterium]
HRLVWNLQYPGFKSFPGILLWDMALEGPSAPPGRYQARLTAGGKTESRWFEIKPDPRLTDVSVADLRQRFDMALRIRDKTSVATAAVISIRALKQQVADRAKKADRGAVRTAAAALRATLSDIEGAIYEVDNRTVEDAKNHPLKLVNKLGYLQKVVESAEAKPTDQAQTVFDLLSAQLTEQLDRLARVSRTEVVKFNSLIRRNGLEPVQVE